MWKCNLNIQNPVQSSAFKQFQHKIPTSGIFLQDKHTLKDAEIRLRPTRAHSKDYILATLLSGNSEDTNIKSRAANCIIASSLLARSLVKTRYCRKYEIRRRQYSNQVVTFRARTVPLITNITNPTKTTQTQSFE